MKTLVLSESMYQHLYGVDHKTTLEGHNGNGDWEWIDEVEVGDKSDHSIENEKTYLIHEYQVAFGNNWHFRWV
jgi:hypothetical protein